MEIDSILVRNLTAGDLWNMERPRGTGPDGGGGQTYIDLPLGSIPFASLAKFLNVPVASIDNFNSVSINAFPIGVGEESTLTFSSRGGANSNRYRIINQNQYRTNSERHDGWSTTNGFPSIPADAISATTIPNTLYENIKLFIVKMVDNTYYVGYVDSDRKPDNWSDSRGLSAIFSVASCEIIYFSDFCDESEVLNILSAWKRKPNVLLYGPPGTGKTYLMNKLWDAFSGGDPIQCLSVDANNRDNPFFYEPALLPFEETIKTSWVTFHQNYNYENFIFATKPIPNGATFELKPYAGLLLESAIYIDANLQVAFPTLGEHKTAIIFIDELNRGNVSRIFGEFITFMDCDYRDGTDNMPLPVPLNNLDNESVTRTKKIILGDGIEIDLPIPWYFPKNVYILASMNSVDKAVAPLDSALSRRFHKINIFPSMSKLAAHLNIDNYHRLLDITNTEGIDNIKVEEIAWLLLYRLNYNFAILMGKDFEIGHSYFYTLSSMHTDHDKYLELAKIWDNSIYPQLQERFSNRADEVLRILRLGRNAEDLPSTDYLYTQKKRPLASDANAIISPWTLNEVSLEQEFKINSNRVIYTLKFLAGLPV